jgi:pimeloyl-ACP methyl ester carboxylesterase
MTDADWERRMAELWAAIEDHEPADFLARVQALTAERPPGDAIALFELAEAKGDTKNPDRGPLLIISGEKDHTVPWAIANGVTEIVRIPNRGHALTIDGGWREVADTAPAFVQRLVS